MHEVRGVRSRPAVLVVADAGPEVGVGHAVRSQALAEELLARGLAVRQVGRMEVRWVADAYRIARIQMLGPVPILDAAANEEVVATVLDSYTVPVATAEAITRLGKPCLAIVDDTTRGLVADVYLEQNPSSSAESLGLPEDRAMCGPTFALIRDQVNRLRSRPWRPTAASRQRPRVAVLFGGTDPAHGVHAVARSLASMGTALSATLVAATPEHARELAGIHWGPEQRAVIFPSHPEIVTDLAKADLVVSAGGSTVYELMCLGRPLVICPVADNQRVTYEHLVGAGLAAGLGPVDELRRDPASGAQMLRELLADPERMASVAEVGFETVDGRGRQRVADRLVGLIATTTA